MSDSLKKYEENREEFTFWEEQNLNKRLPETRNPFDRLEIYDRVNSAETLNQLAEVIRSLADEQGLIQGRTRKFPAEQMARACELYSTGIVSYNTLTREFGIRQQAMYIDYYTPNKSITG